MGPLAWMFVAGWCASRIAPLAKRGENGVVTVLTIATATCLWMALA